MLRLIRIIEVNVAPYIHQIMKNIVSQFQRKKKVKMK